MVLIYIVLEKVIEKTTLRTHFWENIYLREVETQPPRAKQTIVAYRARKSIMSRILFAEKKEAFDGKVSFVTSLQQSHTV